MAAMTTPTSSLAHPALLCKAKIGVSPSPVLGLAQLGMRGGRARCSLERKAVPAGIVQAGIGASSMLAAAAVMSVPEPVLALVDERLSTEGTGLSLGISNNLLVWILVGVFGLIWALYFLYTSTLEEDEESGLSL